MKVSRLVRQGVLVRLKRGFFCLGPEYSEKLIEHGVIANALYGPSYVSFETALSLYGLIPERVYETMSAVVRHGETYKTPFGTFGYYQMPKSVWAERTWAIDPEGYTVVSENFRRKTRQAAKPTRGESKWSYGMPGRRISDALAGWRVLELPGEYYQVQKSKGDDIFAILKAFGMELKQQLYTRGEIR